MPTLWNHTNRRLSLGRSRNNIPQRQAYIASLPELADHTEKQVKRIGKAIRLEDKAGGMPLNCVSQEMSLTKDILKDFVLLEIETGILPRASKAIAGVSTGQISEENLFAWLQDDEALLAALRIEADG